MAIIYILSWCGAFTIAGALIAGLMIAADVFKARWSNWLDDQYEAVADRVVWKMNEKRGDDGRE